MPETTSFATPQETWWSGEFGEDYISRNQSGALLASNLHFFSSVFRRAEGVDSLIEFGANIGMNLRALRQLMPHSALAGVEINPVAAEELRAIGNVEVWNDSLLGFRAGQQFDCTLSKGVLIHISPDHLAEAYATLYEHSKRYICIAEYYNPTPVSVNYRGHEDRLFKRDFAGEMLDAYSDLRLIDYGFAYHRGPFPQDDTTWFLLEKAVS